LLLGKVKFQRFAIEIGTSELLDGLFSLIFILTDDESLATHSDISLGMHFFHINSNVAE
jgi:hypothetical protein